MAPDTMAAVDELDLSDDFLTARLMGAGLHDIRCHGQPIVARVALVIRDTRWGTLDLDVRHVSRQGAGEAQVTGRAGRGELSVDFTFSVALQGAGRMVAASTIRAHSAAVSARCGLVILLDAERSAGAALRWRTGRRTKVAELPRLVGPQRPDGRGSVLPLLGPFSGATVSRPDGARIEAKFAGAQFELEDERNWIDGTFKIYGPPLADGPVHLDPNAPYRQAVELRVRPPVARPCLRRSSILVGPQLGSMPELGTLASLNTEDLAAADEVGALHARVDVDPQRQVTPPKALEGGPPLELALHLRGDAPDFDQLVHWLAALQPRRTIVLTQGGSPTPDEHVSTVRRAAEVAGVSDAVGGGTDTHFADLNRTAWTAASWPFLAIPMSPSAHGRDDATLRQSWAGVRAATQTALRRLHAQAICVTPLLLTPRSGPGSVPDDSTLTSARARASSDAAAAWLVAVLAELVRAKRVNSVTFGSVSGPNALRDDDRRSLPSARVLQACAALVGRPAHQLHGLPAGLAGFAVDGDDRVLVVANTGDAAVDLTVSGTVETLAGEHDEVSAGIRLGPSASLLIGVGPSPSHR